MWLFGPPDVEKMKARRNVKGLIRALNYGKDHEVCNEAARALGQIGDPIAVEPLIGELDSPVYRQGDAAAEALGMIGDSRATEPLIAYLGGPRYLWERETAVRALSEIGDPRAVGPILAALQKRDLEYHRADSFEEQRERLCKAAGDALIMLGKPAVAPLVAALENEPFYFLFQVAVRALGAIGDRSAVQPLLAQLTGGAPVWRKAAVASALAKLRWRPDCSETGAWYWVSRKNWARASTLGAPAVVPFLLGGDAKDARARTEALVGMGEAAVEPLIAALRDERMAESERETAARALGMIGDVRAVEPLIEMLGRKVEFSDQRKAYKAAAEAVGGIGDPRVVVPLIVALRHDGDMRRFAAGILVDMYRRGVLDEGSRKSILARRSIITTPHTDFWASCGGPHEDTGIGVDFPL